MPDLVSIAADRRWIAAWLADLNASYLTTEKKLVKDEDPSQNLPRRFSGNVMRLLVRSVLCIYFISALAGAILQKPISLDPDYSVLEEALQIQPYPKRPGKRKPVSGLSERKYSEVSFIGAHNSEALRTEENDWSLFGNQYFNLTVQLDAGVRLIQAQGHPDPEGSSQIRLCHSFCVFMDGGSLEDYLLEAKTWLLRNPQEVLTFLFVNVGVSLEAWAETYYKTGFDMMSYCPPVDKRGVMGIDDWPTLDDMITCGKRVVTFLSHGADEGRVPWLLSEFDYMFETDYDNEDPDDFSCEVDRPEWPSGWIPDRLSLVNHFLYANSLGFVYPNATYANHTNGAGFRTGELGEHAVRCREMYDRRPNFFLVDFFNEGDIFTVEHGMNAY